MDCSIVPFLGAVPLAPEELRVVIPPDFEASANNLAIEVSKYTQITSPAEEDLVKGGLGRVSSVLAEIEAARVQAQIPVNSVKNAIQSAAAMASEPLEREKERLSKLLAARVAAEQARRDSVIREAYKEKERLVREQKAEVLKLQEQQLKLQEQHQKTMIEARGAETLEEAAKARAEAAKSRAEAAKLDEAISDAKWEQELREETVVIPPKFSEPLMRGARSPEVVELRIKDKNLLISALNADALSEKPIGLHKIVEIKLRKLHAKDFIKDMRELHKDDPNWDLVAEWDTIGVEAITYRKPYVPNSSRIESQ